MSWLLVVAIRTYRLVARAIRLRRTCLFAESCSHRVERAAVEDGFRAALVIMRGRFAACRPGHTFEFDGSTWLAECVDGSRVFPSEASPAVHADAEAARRFLPGRGALPAHS